MTLRAVEDLRQIGRYTLRQWGRDRRNRYLRDLNMRFQWLAAHPEAGRKRDDLAPGYRCYPHQAHVVFYIMRAGGIDIIGVPRQAMDIPAYFDPEAQ